MGELVFINDGKVVTNSLTVADVFGKEHKNVVRDIETQLLKLQEAGEGEWGSLNFEPSQYQHEQNKRLFKMFNLTEEAFTIVAMSYVTPEAMKMKVKFIGEFKKMREQLQNSKVHVLDDRTAFIQSLRLTAETAEKQDEMQKVLMHHNQKLMQIETKVDEQITLDHGEQRRLQKGVAIRVYEFTEDRKEAARLFRELYREIKDRFGVPSYRDLRRKELQSALRYIEHWIPRKVS